MSSTLDNTARDTQPCDYRVLSVAPTTMIGRTIPVFSGESTTMHVLTSIGVQRIELSPSDRAEYLKAIATRVPSETDLDTITIDLAAEFRKEEPWTK